MKWNVRNYWLAIIILTVFSGFSEINELIMSNSQGNFNEIVLPSFIGLMGKFISSIFTVWFLLELWKIFKTRPLL